MFSALFEIVGEVIAGLLWRLIPRRSLPAGPVKSATLPSDVTEAVVAALKVGQDAAATLPKGWRSFRTGLASQAAPEAIARVPIGTDLQLAIETDPVGDRDRVRVEGLGYLTSDEELERALLRGQVRCWLAARQPTARYADGAVILFVAVYDPAWRVMDRVPSGGPACPPGRRESTRVHSGVDRFDADGIRLFGPESTNPPTPHPPEKHSDPESLKGRAHAAGGPFETGRELAHHHARHPAPGRLQHLLWAMEPANP